MNDTPPMTDVESVLAMHNLPSPSEAETMTPEVTEPPIDEVEQLKADIMAHGDPVLIARFEKLMSDAETILQRKAEQDALMRTLIAGSEIFFVEAYPEAATALFNAMSPEDQAAFRETLRVQYELAHSKPVYAGGDGRMEINPMAVNPPTLGGDSNAHSSQS